MAGREDLAALLRPLVERMHNGHCWKKTDDGPRRIDVAFSEILLEEHVLQQMAYGLCPISPGSTTCRVAALDLDSHKGEVPWPRMLEVAESLKLSLELDGYAPHLFRSSGGSGIHLYLTWQNAQDAHSVREMLRAALASCDLKSGTKGVAHGQVEIFPKQSEVKADGFGSMFILPWAGASAPLGVFESWVDSPDVPVREREERDNTRAATEVLPAELQRVRSALAHIPNAGPKELDYDAWRNIIFALHAATDGSDEGLALAHEFSAKSSKYDADFLDHRVWPYINENREGNIITEGTLYAEAEKEDWQDPATLDAFDVQGGEASAAPDRRADGEAQVSPGADRDARNAQERAFVFVPEATFCEAAPSSWIVDDVIPEADLAVVYGESGSGKSFFALDLVASIALGTAWRDKQVQQGRVAYIAAEGAAGFRKRIRAYKRTAQIDSLDLHVLADAPNMLDPKHVKAVVRGIQALGACRVVVIDTLARVAPGGAENSSEDMGKLIMHCEMVRKYTGAMVLLIHHSGKDAAKGMRGWSGLRGAVDCEIEITREGHERLATITKQKDGDEGAQFGFKLQVVEIGLDGRGRTASSCVVEHGAASPILTRGKQVRLRDNELLALTVATDLTGLAADDEGTTKDEIVAGMNLEGKQAAVRAGRAVDSLVQKGRLLAKSGRLHVV